jgi:hypothetical protein
MEERAKLQDVAPKDVKQLEVLRPVNVPPMGARFKELLAKEQRLEASSRPVQKHATTATAVTTTKTKKGDEAEVKDGPARKKRKKSQGKGAAAATDSKAVTTKDDEGDLLQEDEIKEGIDWSDDEEE